MANTGVSPIKQALVRALRNHAGLYAQVGSDGINEGLNPRVEGDEDYPQIVYDVVHARRDYDWSNLLLEAEFDVISISRNQVEAQNLDQLVAEALEVDISTHFEGSSGQTSLLCQRITDLSSVDVDGAGDRVYQVGGSYRIWTDQVRTA